jgi:DNA invertase Pin-like site-specific DNA recombinase
MYDKTAAAYIRVSTDDQTELSPESQLKEIRKYTEQHNIELLEEHIYIDEGTLRGDKLL